MKTKSDKDKRSAEAAAVTDLRRIPGVGKSIAGKLYKIGVSSVKDLYKKDPQALYEALQQHYDAHVDRCVLYVFRCAVYYASVKPEKHEPELLKWWNHKDKEN